ncbi:MAG: polysaccharide deacetylase family protein [Planctomycetaceae bacterium]|nr:polysaccharide deacetylase family protein [Planctomycetaceae bacterium]
MSLGRQFIKGTMSRLLPRDRFLLHGPTSTNGDATCVEIALTFDDGPHPEWTPVVLDALAKAGWKGTFFVIGERAAEHPELVKRIVEEGHAIGNHSYTHSEPSRTAARQFADETRRTSELIDRLTGTHSSLIRPPKGKLSLMKFVHLWQNEQSIVLWNVDPKDFAMTDDVSTDSWCDSYKPHQGDVILLHDRLPHAATIVQRLAQRHADHVKSVSVFDWLPSAISISPSSNGVSTEC